MSTKSFLDRKIQQNKTQKALIEGIRSYDISKVRLALEGGAEIFRNPLRVAIDLNNAEALAEMIKTERGAKAASLGHYDILRETNTYLPFQYRTRSYLSAAIALGKENSALILAQCPYINVEDAGHFIGMKKDKHIFDSPLSNARKKNMASVVKVIEERLKAKRAILNVERLSDKISPAQNDAPKPNVDGLDQLGRALAEAFTSSRQVNALGRKIPASEDVLKRIQKLEDEVKNLLNPAPVKLNKPRFSIPKASPQFPKNG